jgi:hypothetical protein
MAEVVAKLFLLQNIRLSRVGRTTRALVLHRAKHSLIDQHVL